eukprot:11876899-Alexandrium_andersonii.AAC.1
MCIRDSRSIRVTSARCRSRRAFDASSGPSSSTRLARRSRAFCRTRRRLCAGARAAPTLPRS